MQQQQMSQQPIQGHGRHVYNTIGGTANGASNNGYHHQPFPKLIQVSYEFQIKILVKLSYERITYSFSKQLNVLNYKPTLHKSATELQLYYDKNVVL